MSGVSRSATQRGNFEVQYARNSNRPLGRRYVAGPAESLCPRDHESFCVDVPARDPKPTQCLFPQKSWWGSFT